MNNIKLSLFILLSMSWLVASTVRIMTYNLLNFEDENDREDDFIAIIGFIIYFDVICSWIKYYITFKIFTVFRANPIPFFSIRFIPFPPLKYFTIKIFY